MLVEFFFEAIPAIIPKVFSDEKSQKTFFPSIRAITLSFRYYYKVLRHLFFKIILYICISKFKDMETLIIQFESNIKAKILELLHSFLFSELKTVKQDPVFDTIKKILDN